MQRIHSLYRAWNRNRADVDTLRQLHAAIGDYRVTGKDQETIASSSPVVGRHGPALRLGGQKRRR